MTRKNTIHIAIILAALAVSCVTDREADVDDLAASDESAGELEDDVEFRAGPTFPVAEHIDKCCPITAAGVQDTLCADDVSNTCPAASFPTGGGITGWTVVNCWTCGVNSTNCSNTRWKDNGVYGFECAAVATRRSNNELVDDDCATWGGSGCTDAFSGHMTTFCNGLCGADESYQGHCQTDDFDASVGMMCCTDSSAQNCIPPSNINGVVGCGNANVDSYHYWPDHGYTRKTWCFPCTNNTSTSDENDGGWDLYSDPGDGDEWEQSLQCLTDLTEDNPNPADAHITRYACGGFAFLSTGASFTESCPDYP